MATIRGLRYYEVAFNADGTPDDAAGGSQELTAAVAAGGISDLFVFSHGWNTGLSSARDLYNDMFGQLADQLGTHLAGAAAVGVLWPSLLFPDDDPAVPTPQPSTGAELAAALSPAFAAPQQDALTTMGALLDEQPQDPDRLEQFHTLAKGLVLTPSDAAEDAGEASFAEDPTGVVLAHASAMAPKADSGAQGSQNPFAALWTGAREVLRTSSYYEMKNRAGVVGRRGLGPLLANLRGPTGAPRVHLIGHSFGARLVSYSLTGLNPQQSGAASPVKSLTLIQGAFSHFAFADSLPFDSSRPGALAGMELRVDGPLLATFTNADRAVGWWYPTASLLSREDNQAATDLNFRWGAVGHDGYQLDPAPAQVRMAPAGHAYNFETGRFYSLDANAVIKENQSAFSGAHSDIRHPEVLCAVVNAARLN